jgi:hypothetical protein
MAVMAVMEGAGAPAHSPRRGVAFRSFRQLAGPVFPSVARVARRIDHPRPAPPKRAVLEGVKVGGGG